MIYGYDNSVQISVLLKASGIGYLIGFVFIFLESIKFIHKSTVIPDFIRDIIFFSVSSLFFFMYALKYNSGIFRFYLLGSFILGFLLFYLFPGTFLVRRLTDMQLLLSGKFERIKFKLKKILCFCSHVSGKEESSQ